MKMSICLFSILLITALPSCSRQDTLINQEPLAPPLEAGSNADGQGNQALPSEPDSVATAPTPRLSLPADPGLVIQPSDLEYLGAFRLPGESGGSNWDYSGRGLTYYPDGDPGGEADGFPGSLFGVGFDQQNFVSEISIPVPVNSRSLEELNTAVTLQPFADITRGMFGEGDLPRLGIQYLPPMYGHDEGRLYYVHGQHFQDIIPSHGSSRLDLADPRPDGPWTINGYSTYATSDYIFEIPLEWAVYLPGEPRLATGRFREGVWSGLGPALFAFSPLENGQIPTPKATLTQITPLLLYGVQEPGLTDITSRDEQSMTVYNADDSWWGGAWLTAGEKSAVIFTGTKGLGNTWYGFANGVVWEYDCADSNPPTCPEVPEWPYDNRGYWAERYQPQVIFYDPIELVKVANGGMETWEPQPYATLDLSNVFYDPVINLEEYKYDIAGAVAFDRERGLLYIFERLADEYRSVIHVWRVN